LATGATVAAHFAPPNHFRDRTSLTIEIGDLRFSCLRGDILIKIHVRELLRVAKAEPRMMNTMSLQATAVAGPAVPWSQHVRPARQNDRLIPSALAGAIAKVLHFQASAESVLKSVYEFLCKIATNSY
jgi:hypothetical protein